VYAIAFQAICVPASLSQSRTWPSCSTFDYEWSREGFGHVDAGYFNPPGIPRFLRFTPKFGWLALRETRHFERLLSLNLLSLRVCPRPIRTISGIPWDFLASLEQPDGESITGAGFCWLLRISHRQSHETNTGLERLVRDILGTSMVVINHQL
jgi:hypothetical protein